MFYFDNQIISFVYNHCKSLGCAFGCGALEGFITYIGIIVLGITEGLKNDK